MTCPTKPPPRPARPPPSSPRPWPEQGNARPSHGLRLRLHTRPFGQDDCVDRGTVLWLQVLGLGRLVDRELFDVGSCRSWRVNSGDGWGDSLLSKAVELLA